jgi:hypothetical protein
MAAIDRFAEAHWPPDTRRTISGANAATTSQRSFREKVSQKPSSLAGRLRWTITHKRMKRVDEQLQRRSKVPRLSHPFTHPWLREPFTENGFWVYEEPEGLMNMDTFDPLQELSDCDFDKIEGLRMIAVEKDRSG